MNNYLSIANNILTGSLRPWSAENKDEEKFRHLLNHNLRQNRDNPAKFCRSALNAFTSLNFVTENENLEELKELAQVEVSNPIIIETPQYFNKQTEFYLYLINNTFQCLVAGIDETIEQSDEIDATYKLYQIMNKLESLIGIISNEKHTDKTTNQILDSLKLYLFVTHSTLTEIFNSHINFEVLSKNEILFQLCPELESEKDDKFRLSYYLNRFISLRKDDDHQVSGKKTKPEPITVKPQETHKIPFTPILDDNRPTKKGVVSFHDLVRNPQRFGSFEEKLFQNDFITSEYAYCGKQGYKNQLAIIYHLLIEKNYFNHFNDTNKNKITSRDIVKFLNHRYDVDVDKQFRSYKSKPEERAEFMESAYWLFQLPMC